MAVHNDVAGTKVARAIGLHYVVEGEPGLTRVRRGKTFAYRDAKGRARSRRANARPNSIARDSTRMGTRVDCARADGHVQATGRDARGRKQHRYHPGWTAARHESKYGR